MHAMYVVYDPRPEHEGLGSVASLTRGAGLGQHWEPLHVHGSPSIYREAPRRTWPVDLVKHQRRVGIILWHPSAQNILLSTGSDNNVVIWNVGTGEALLCFTLPDLVYSGCWNWDGSEVLFTCKDRKIRRVDPR